MKAADNILYGAIEDDTLLSYAEVEEKLCLLGEALMQKEEDLPEDLLFEIDSFSLLRGPVNKDSKRRMVFILSHYLDSDSLLPELAEERWDGGAIYVSDQSELNLRQVLEAGQKELADFPFTLQMISERADELLRQWG